MKSIAAIMALLACASFTTVCSAETRRVYHIGNSLTDNIYYGGLKRLAEQKNDTYTYGKEVSPGVPLDMLWAGKSKTGSIYSQGPYGTYTNALKNYTWDDMTLEPFDNWLPGSTGDVQIAENFINYATKKSPNLQTYIYERWPRRPLDSKGNFLPFDYTATYTKAYTSSPTRYDLADERQGYFVDLVNDINKAMPKAKNKVDLVPVGDVFEDLDKLAKAKKLNGISSITQFYEDSIHMNKMGAYVISLTFYATMFDKDPVGTTVPGAFSPISSKLAGEIQNAVWSVVSTNPLDGVKASTAVAASAVVPEPTTLALLALLPLFRRNRRR